MKLAASPDHYGIGDGAAFEHRHHLALGDVAAEVMPRGLNGWRHETESQVSGNSLQIPCSRIKIPCSACKNSLLRCVGNFGVSH
jgi:hypothetical protein